MNSEKEKVVITEINIEEMCLLAEDVMQQLYMNFADYDENGNDLIMKYNRKGTDYEKDIAPLIREERETLLKCPEYHLLYDLFCRSDDIGKVRYYTLEDIRPWIAPIIPKVLQLFRKGTNDCGETNFVAAESVPDDYLMAVFSREVRNMMMMFAGQRMQREDIRRYLLLLEASSCHDMDEWRGIYFDDENLKKAYDDLTAEWEERKKEDRSYRSLHVAIWEFCPDQEIEDMADSSNPTDNRRQRIRPVKPENLQCFKKKD